MVKRTLVLAALTLGFAAAGEMHVEEPEIPAVPPIDPEKDERWLPRRQTAPLTEKEKADIAARRRKVEELVARIRAQREALEESQGEDKARRAQELKRLILEDEGEEETRQDRRLRQKEAQADRQSEKRERIEETQERKKEREERRREDRGNKKLK